MVSVSLWRTLEFDGRDGLVKVAAEIAGKSRIRVGNPVLQLDLWRVVRTE